ncbi:type I restriction-modification system specificity determinant [Alishewanella agri BL06]|uniref:Type I restriction-modification system specificity determinant n=1 Tax=Alishewanella agri BL06 TaxID=1195246 RepID=I8U8F8_9ALTE|nr:restriction endonuclease subunit S [Alishewanella agri]EIW89586.1 type I restriction-modification system specificity determinant [Alishewanella agri BL06]
MDSMPKYASYKDSGVEWLGNIPSDWNLKPGFVAFTENKRNNKGMKENTVLSLSYGKIVIKPEEKLVGLVPESFETYQLVEPNDIIVRCTDLQNDKVSLRTGLAKDNGIITSAYLNLKVRRGFNSRFLHYYLHSLDTTKVIYKFGSGLRQNLSFLDFKRLPVFDISESIQIAVADYLDQKTAQIDEAIAIKEQQIALLKERKQIIIQQAVTQGLDPNVPMKDSGVEWIGRIPKHWHYEPIKYSLKGIVDCEHKTAPFVDEEEFFVVRTTNVKDGKINLTGAKYTHAKGYKEWTRRGIPTPGDILLTREAPAGEACTVPEDLKLCLGQRMVWLKVDRTRLVPEFGVALIYSSIGRTYIDFLSAGSTVLHFNMSDIANIPVVLPPLDEQKALVEYINCKSVEIENSSKILSQQIEKLREYKTTLINSAVTGKIKVA